MRAKQPTARESDWPARIRERQLSVEVCPSIEVGASIPEVAALSKEAETSSKYVSAILAYVLSSPGSFLTLAILGWKGPMSK